MSICSFAQKKMDCPNVQPYEFVGQLWVQIPLPDGHFGQSRAISGNRAYGVVKAWRHSTHIVKSAPILRTPYWLTWCHLCSGSIMSDYIHIGTHVLKLNRKKFDCHKSLHIRPGLHVANIFLPNVIYPSRRFGRHVSARRYDGLLRTTL